MASSPARLTRPRVTVVVAVAVAVLVLLGAATWLALVVGRPPEPDSPPASMPSASMPTASRSAAATSGSPSASTSTHLSSPPSTVPSSQPGVTSLGHLEATADAEQALGTLASLSVLAEVLAGYDRDAFGEAWADVDGNGCNQRDDVLLRDAMQGTVTTAVQGSCDHDVLAGSWHDPYTGTLLVFDDLKDQQQAQAIPIDHVVPLSEAHKSGAHAWNADQLSQFANDVTNLVAVGGSANSSKGDSDPATWLPPDAVRCDYAVIWVEVKSRWGLAIDADELTALRAVLEGC